MMLFALLPLTALADYSDGQNCGSCGHYHRDNYCCGGWQPEDPHNPPKFCPECGDIFDDNDIQ